MENPKSQTNNLFLLGAGFTKAVYLDAPLNKDILQVLFRDSPHTVLKRYYRQHKIYDIEVLLTYLDLEILRPRTKKQSDLRTYRNTIEQQLAEYFMRVRFKKKLLEKEPWLESFVKLFKENDAIISLNYDCFLEGLLDYYEVWSPKEGYAVLDSNPLLGSEFPQNEKNIRIFKLHGSEHFVEAPDPMNKTKTAIDFPIDESIYPRSGKNRNFGYGGSQPESRNYIIAPSFVKIPHQDIELMMLNALETAGSVKNLVIIGCGLRKEDGFLWLLLTNFLNQTIRSNRKLIIVDPCAKDIKDKICDHFFVDINNFINIKLFPNSLAFVIEQLINELHDNNA